MDLLLSANKNTWKVNKMEIEQSANLFRAIYDNSLDGILLTKPDGRIINANRAACEIFQHDEIELCRIGLEGVVDITDSGLGETIKTRINNGKAKSKISLKRKDGCRFQGELTSALFFDENGDNWVVIYVRDVSDSNVIYSAQQGSQQALYDATHDFLTGVLNRRAFNSQLQEVISDELNSFGLIMIDIDLFKQINDTYGHTSGDIVLKLFADCLKNNLRPMDILGRFGGDEFIVCLPNTKLSDVIEIAERLRLKITEILISFIDAKITASLGVATFNNSIGETIESLICRVDYNMYKAKEKRNSIYIL